MNETFTNLTYGADLLNDNLYHQLWYKEKVYPETEGLDLSLPDTVIFQSGFPTTWYFCSREGTIKQKKKENIDSQAVYDVFTRRKKTGILAQMIYVEQTVPLESTTRKSSEKLTIEYLDEPLLREFLTSTTKPSKVILQKFVEPHNSVNNMIQVIWTSHFSIFAQRRNHHKINDPHRNIYDKCVTFDGPDHLSDLGIAQHARSF
jgi:hypothetical protein